MICGLDISCRSGVGSSASKNKGENGNGFQSHGFIGISQERCLFQMRRRILLLDTSCATNYE